MTAWHQLQKFADASAQLYSYSGLHSKVAVFDDEALIGSANLSGGAGVETCEASLLTDDPQIVALALAFIEKVRLASVPITPAFLRRIALIPVKQFRHPVRRSAKKIVLGDSRTWFISTRPPSEQIINSEAPLDGVGMEEAKRRAIGGGELESVRWAGKSRFRLVAKEGDLVIQAFSWRGGSRRFTEVYTPAPIIYRHDHADWTRFYLEYPSDAGAYPWREVESMFKSVGARNITRDSVRELTGSSLAITYLLK